MKDLSQQPPRSALVRLGGVVMAARTADKCVASQAGTLGEYVYGCPLDQKLFEFLGTTAEELASVVGGASNPDRAEEGEPKREGEAQVPKDSPDGNPADSTVEAFIQSKLAGRAEEEVLAWNQDFLRYEPDLSEGHYADMAAALKRRAPNRPDVTLWVDLTDIEEGRTVPTVEEVRERRALLGLPAAGDG